MSDNLLPCPLPACGHPVAFHQDAEDCPSGCHYIKCSHCHTMFDMSHMADPNNKLETMEELRVEIAALWNAWNFPAKIARMVKEPWCVLSIYGMQRRDGSEFYQATLTHKHTATLKYGTGATPEEAVADAVKGITE